MPVNVNTPVTDALSDPSPVAASLADELTPAIVAGLDARKAEILDAMPNLVARVTLRSCWPTALRLVPIATGLGADALLTRFGGMTVTDLVGLIVTHQRAKGLPVNLSLKTFHDHP